MASEKRLIDANALKAHFPTTGIFPDDLWLAAGIRIAIDNAPTVDAVEVVHGRWEQMGESDYKCSVCGFRFTSGDPIVMFPYCRCGAKMDGDENG